MIMRILGAVVGGFVAVFAYAMFGGPTPADHDVGVLFWKNPPQFVCMMIGAAIGYWMERKRSGKRS